MEINPPFFILYRDSDIRDVHHVHDNDIRDLHDAHDDVRDNDIHDRHGDHDDGDYN